MNVLITGGAGFIGSHLTDRLLGRGDRVVIIDSLRTGSLDNLAEVRSNPNLKTKVGNVCDRGLMDELIRGIDVVYHLAAPVGVKHILQHPVRTLTDSMRSADVLFELCHRYKCPVLVASSSEVYGKNLDLIGDDGRTLSEDDYLLRGSPKDHRWAYATIKSLDESLAFAYHKEFGLPATVGRFFNVVGPRQSSAYGMVIPTFVGQALAGQPITVYGSGKQSRSFLHVADAVTAIIGLMDRRTSAGDMFNIGHGAEITIHALAELIRKRTGADVPIEIIGYKEAYGDGFEDMIRRVPNTAKIEKHIGFAPTYDLNAILDEVIAHQRAELASA
jgi:UDP-glucose 4-epimerase